MSLNIGDKWAFTTKKQSQEFIQCNSEFNFSKEPYGEFGEIVTVLSKKENEIMDVQNTLQSRSSSHGDFRENGRIMQYFKNGARTGQNWNNLTAAQKEAIDMICHKIGRILSGDPNHADHWHDIAGYATLCENIILTGDPYQSQPPQPAMKGSNDVITGMKKEYLNISPNPNIA